MNIAYNWTFPQFDTAPSIWGETDVVQTIHWRLNGTDADSGKSAEVYGTVGYSEPLVETFVDFASITKDWTIAHVTAIKPLADLQAAIAAQISNLINPPTVPMAPPFGA